MPNIIAYLTFWCWPFVAILINKKYPKTDAVILLILVPYLFFPANMGINLHLSGGIPKIDKGIISAYTAFALLWTKYGSIGLFPTPPLFKILIFCTFLYPLFSWLTNLDPYSQEVTFQYMEGLPFGFFTQTVIYSIENVIFFILGYTFLKTEQAQIKLLQYIFFFGILYSVLALWEIKMSPKLHAQLYGYFPHDWVQAKRQGGFRSIVFLGHGLLVSVFLSITFMSALILKKQAAHPLNKFGMLTIAYLYFVLIFNKTWSGVIYATIAFILINYSTKKLTIYFSALLTLGILTYPILRAGDYVPTESILDTIKAKNADRAGSLRFRFENEYLILQKGNQRPAFGWGGNARDKIYNPNLKTYAIPDGIWVIVFSKFGWFGYLTIYGILSFPILFWYKIAKTLPEHKISATTTGIALMLTLNLLDLIPNSSLSPLTFLFPGSILGYIVTHHYRKNQAN